MAQDDPPGRVGRIAAVQGEVWVYEAEQGEWVAALHNRPFTGGDRLSTAPEASVEVRIGSTTLMLGGSSELEALRLDDERMQFRLQRGSLALRVRSREVAAELEVLNPEARFLPLRAGLYRIDRQDESSAAGVWRGDLQVEGNGLALTMYAGQRARFWQDGPLSDMRSQWLAPLEDDFALAVQREDLADPRSAAASFVPPEMTGVEDLDRHGRWQQHPDYGAVWSPSVVTAGWAPYRYGQWVWMQPWGWTWVDDAPWGFAPFHYGRWLWWGSRWCWAPGPMVPRPVFAPALVGWMGGPPLNVSVGSRAVPAVGWVPLAPREHYRPVYRASPGYVNRLNPHGPQAPGSPPAFGNRVVPGAVTVLPSPSLAPRQPVAAAALRADEMVLQRQWQAGQFNHQPPGRQALAERELAAPRAPFPFGAAQPGLGPVPPRPRAQPVLPGGTASALPGSATVPLPGQAPAPFFGPSPRTAQPVGPTRERGTVPGAPAAAATARPPQPSAAAPAPAMASPMPARAPPHHAAPAPATAVAAPGAVPAVPPAQAVAPKPVAQPPRTATADERDIRDTADPGERRRTPESRQKGRER